MGDTILSALRGELQSALVHSFPETQINDRLAQLNCSIKFTKEEVQNLLALQYKTRQTFLVLSLLYPNFDFSNGFHIDHVYPRSKMTQRRLLTKDVSTEHAQAWPDLRDTLANLQLLQGGPNQAKSDTDFDKWLDDQLGDKRGYFLAMHHFPDWSSFPYAKFGDFIADREAIFKEYLEKVLS